MKTESKLEVCASLLREHRWMENKLGQLEQALSGLESATVNAVTSVRQVMDEIVPEMNTHFACEEQVLFPAVSPYHPMVLMEVEHEELINLRGEFLMALATDSIEHNAILAIQALGRRFISDMLDHIGREDAGIFPTCERALSDDEKEAVVAGMEHLREEAKTKPVPAISRPERGFEVFYADLDQPAQRAIFSQRLLDTNGLEVKHLTVQAGQSLSQHWSPNRGLLICLKGTGQFQAEESQIEIKPGSIISMTPQLRHGVHAGPEDCHLLLLLGA